MGDDMVERVARAIAEHYGQSPSFNWQKHEGAARAAISAMREPTLDMKRAAWAEARSIDAAESADVPYDFRGNDRTGAVYKAMIDVALTSDRANIVPVACVAEDSK